MESIFIFRMGLMVNYKWRHSVIFLLHPHHHRISPQNLQTLTIYRREWRHLLKIPKFVLVRPVQWSRGWAGPWTCARRSSRPRCRRRGRRWRRRTWLLGRWIRLAYPRDQNTCQSSGRIERSTCQKWNIYLITGVGNSFWQLGPIGNKFCPRGPV